MRVLVSGCREWRPWGVACDVLVRLSNRHGRCVIVHGSATGVDATFHEEAIAAGHAVEPHPADWKDIDVPGAVVRRRRDGTLYNANAGPLRNAEMVAAGADLCLAVHRDIRKSKGTRGCALLAMQAGIPTYLIDSEDVPSRPRRITPDDLA